tara:strand:- start:3234 stop:3737 length:504 start_codon:yes stop_codon:yes gene_type:complete
MESVKGLQDLLKKLEKLGDAKEIDGIAEGISREIQLDAVQRAPVNFGQLRQSIKQSKIGPLKYEVVVGADYGSYVEFGTGPRVQVPPEFAQMAQQFKGGKGGSFKDGLKSIKDWCRAKGIPESAAYPILMSLLKKGMRPQPYLYPAFVKGRLQYFKDLEEYFKRLTK